VISFDPAEYEGVRRVSYGDSDDEYGKAVFVPVCETCGRFVKADKTVTFGEHTISDKPNATCSRCGRTHMLFEGFL
jgi:hypothetical protein